MRGAMGESDRLTPVVQRRRLRVELRRARLDAGQTQQDVADAMEWSLSKVIRIEAGSVNISPNDLKALLRYLGIVDAQRTEEFLVLARAARERSWWSGYRSIISSQLFQFLEYEAAASIIRNFEPLLIPGLLQTEDYATAIIRQWDAPWGDRSAAEHADSLVELRMRRQDLLDRADPPLLFFILDEAVARRVVGGEAVMHRQIRHLMDMADRPNVTIEVIPFGGGIHPAMAGPFVIHEFPDAADDDVLYLESRGDLVRQDSVDEISSYRETFEQLREMSLGPAGSVEYLSKLADETI
jgi:transcriptional regulator with XRE-family HTH domain